jgi:hypothetical protein
MRTFMRIAFGLNALYQIAVGVVCLLAPATAAGLHGGGFTEASTLLLVTFRLLGVNLIPAGIVSIVVAFDPDRHPILRALMGLIATLTLICWGIVVGMHTLAVGQVASMILNVVVQICVLVAVVIYYPRATTQVVVRRRSYAA